MSRLGGAFPPADRQQRDAGAGPSCCYRRAHDDPTHAAHGHRGRRPRGRDGVLRRAGLKLHGEGLVEGGWVDRVVGLEDVRADIAMVETPGTATDGSS